MLNRDGVELFYAEAGSGEPPVLLVHGLACDHTAMAPLFTYFRRNHRVITVDLRGHGESDKPEQDYTMATFADDLAWICGELGIEKPIVIGHSMGGVIAVELAARFPGLPIAIVTLDAPVAPPRVLVDRLTSLAEGFRSPAFQELQSKFVDSLFLPTDNKERQARIKAGMMSTPQHVAVSAFANIFADTTSAIQACRVPLLVLSATESLSDPTRLREVCPHVVTGQTVGAGHFHQLEVPEQINPMIERFLTIALGI
jgi:pimeloyl-ACP methyl ester carboxylesterase